MTRYEAGETLASIARTYDCSPPAISYIVSRTRARNAAAEEAAVPVAAASEPQAKLIKSQAVEPAAVERLPERARPEPAPAAPPPRAAEPAPPVAPPPRPRPEPPARAAESRGAQNMAAQSAAAQNTGPQNTLGHGTPRHNTPNPNEARNDMRPREPSRDSGLRGANMPGSANGHGHAPPAERGYAPRDTPNAPAYLGNGQAMRPTAPAGQAALAVAPGAAHGTAPGAAHGPAPGPAHGTTSVANGEHRRTLHLSLGQAANGPGGPPQSASGHAPAYQGNGGSQAPYQPYGGGERGAPRYPAATPPGPPQPAAPHYPASGNGDGFARPNPEPQRPKDAAGSFIDQALRERVGGDVEAFLTAFDAALAQDSIESRAGLREATDRLLRAGARTRIELERLEARVPLAGRDKGGQDGSAWRQPR
jgi:hypothetical protein